MKKLFFLAAFSVLFISTSIQAQQNRVITLGEAIELALENNYQLKQAKNDLDLAGYSITSEKADFLPSLSSSFGGSSREGRTQIEVGDQIRTINLVSNSLNGGISGSITLFAGFDNILTLRSSQSTKISREENFNRVKESLIFNTATRYLQVLLDKELLEIANENLLTSQKQLDQVKAQVEVGSRPSVDQFNQEATVANNELIITQRENSLSLNKLLLVRQLQIDPTKNYEFTNPLTGISTLSGREFELNDLVNQALENRSDIKSAVSNIESLRYRLMLSKGQLLPTLTGDFGISTNYSDQRRVAGESVSFGDQFFDQEISKSIGFTLRFSIFSNWNRMYNIESAKINYKNAQLSLEDTELQVIQEITQAYNDYKSYQKQLEASEKALIASEKAFQTQQERYNVGASTLIELSQAQASFVQAQSDKTQALYNLVFQEKLLDYYLGKLSGEDISF